MFRDLHSNTKTQLAATPTTQSGNTVLTGSIIDTAETDAVEFHFFVVGTPTGGSTWTPSIAESNDSGMAGSNAVAASDLRGTLAGATITGSNAPQTGRFGYKGSKRYVQLTLTPSGNSASATFGAIATFWLKLHNSAQLA